jgi:tetratricopeptide (TPR) repeat protein
MWSKFYITIITLFCAFNVLSQTAMDKKLAFNYFNEGEYAKAAVYFEKIYPSDNSHTTFDQYFECLMQTEEMKDAEKLVKSQIKANPDDLRLAIYEGKVLESQGKSDKAQSVLQDAIESIDKKTNQTQISRLAIAFQKEGMLDKVIQTYQIANKHASSPSMYNRNIAMVYGQQGKTELMVTALIDIIDEDDRYFASVQSALSSSIDFEDPKKVEILKNELIGRSQKQPNKEVYNEMLAWTYMLTQNYNGAFIQYKAIDKKNGNTGIKINQLGNTCLNNNEYDVAIKCFDYVIELGENKPFYRQAKINKATALKKKVLSGNSFTQQDLIDLRSYYELSIEQLGKGPYSLTLMRELAYIEGYYLNNPAKGVILLEEAVNIPGISPLDQAATKVELGDLMVIDERIWDASLLFMQVEKKFKEDKIGHLAKFKAAEIFYYSGDFDWCQAQLDVLKSSTSKLIANDAMELSMLITDNYNMDTTQVTMRLFANADLLIKQHKYEDALTSYDSITALFTYHTLNDEILMKKSDIALLQQHPDVAITHLEEILTSYGTDILADNALFKLAQIYEQKGDTDKAAEYYKRIMFDYKGSLFGVEARKKYRELAPEKSPSEMFIDGEIRPSIEN